MNEQANMAARYEHEIPEGYEARIEGDKVIIELKETEDEKIRKEIIDYLNFAESHNLLRVADHKKKKGWLAYLERQKEQIIIKQNIIDSIRANTQPDWDFSTIPNLHKEINRFFGEKFVLPHTEDTVITVSDVIRCAYHFYKFGQQEQQPVEWSKEDERMFDSIIGDISIADKRMGGTPTLDIKKQWLEKKIAQGKKQEPDNIQWPKVSNCIHNCKNCQAKCLYRQEQYQEQPIPTTIIHNGLYGIKIE